MLNPLTPALLSQLESRLPKDTLRPAETRYLTEPRGKWHGTAAAVALPRSTTEAAKIIAFCADHRIAVIPYGGGTGLVAGQVSDLAAPLLISLERMNAIRAVLPAENVLIAEAGASLQSLQDAAQEAGRLFPLSIASKGTAQIGGNLATNAGGLNVLRYGNARDLCLGLEAVMPSGDIWHGLTRLRKDNTGYDLRNLLIGSEGTLALITAATLKLFARPQHTGTALFAVASPEAAIDCLGLLRDIAGESISAFELISRQGLEFLDEVGPSYRAPFAHLPDWMLLVELGVGADLLPQAISEQFFERALDMALVVDGLIAQSKAQSDALWNIRETIPEANKRIGSISSHDISLPITEIPAFIADMPEKLKALGPFRINCFGHLGDGNLHYNVFPPKGQDRSLYSDSAAAIQALVHQETVTRGGSFSAEHGVGRLKATDLARFADPVRYAAMKSIKTALDPQGIMNPGAVLPK